METGSETSEKATLGTSAEIEVLGGCTRRLKAVVPVDKVSGELDKNYRELVKNVQLPGFRRGRVPRKLLEVRFGDEIDADVKSSLVGQSFGEVVEEKGLKLLGSPRFGEIKFSHDADLSYEVDFELWPEFEVGQYKGIEVAYEPVALDEAALESEIENLRKSHARHVAIDVSAAGPLDSYFGKYTLLRDGVRVKTSEGVVFTPSRCLLAEFAVSDLEDRVKAWGPSSDSPLALEVAVPANYPDEVLRGAQLKCEFALDEVRHEELPTLDDAFAKELGKESLADLRAEVKASLESRAKRREEARIEEAVLEKIVGALPSFDLPESLIESQKGRWLHEREYELLSEGGKSPEEVKKFLDEEEKDAGAKLALGLKTFFVLEKIAEAEKIFVTEDEADMRLRLLAALYHVPAAKLREEMRSSGRLEELRHSLRHEKVRTFLGKKAVVTGRPAELAPGAAGPAADAPLSDAPVEKAES